jgi:hypothetical protein
MSTADHAFHMRRIRLERARAKGHAEGDPGEGYVIVAPLDESGHLSAEGWRIQRALCFVHRMEGSDIAERGLLAHRAGGPAGGTWVFDYDPRFTGEEEAGFHFESHVFTPGEYVSIRNAEGAVVTYRVASVDPA